MKIDFVSDVSCPWCVIGLRSLESALRRIGDALPVDLHLQPFELNPDLPPEGEEIAGHIARKYGASPQDIENNRERIRALGESVGFSFQMDRRSRIYNTFDAHRLLHWAETEDAALAQALKHALFAAYFSDGENPSSHTVLLQRAVSVGLDAERAKTVLASDAFAEDVREREAFYRRQGITAVPAVIINDLHLIEGGQPVEVFEQALRQIAELAPES